MASSAGTLLVLQSRDRLQIAELELRHSAAVFPLGERDLDAVVLEYAREVEPDLRFVAVDIAGREQRDLAAGLHLARRGERRLPARRELPARGVRMIARHRARRSTPSADSRILRPMGLWLNALTASTITGMPAMLPTASVALSNLSRQRVAPLRFLTALARSIRWGKSTFHGCGGTYGHLVM